MKISNADAERLIHDPSPASKADTAAKIAQTLSNEEMSPEERGIAMSIFRLLLTDVEVLVRRSLSENLKSYPTLPRDIALALANDIAEVATPVLETSKVLTDVDLIAILKTQPGEHQRAIATRDYVSPTLSAAIVELGEETAVAALMGNNGADILEPTFQRALDRFPESDDIMAPMVARDRIPASVAERLVTLVSENLREQLVAKHDLSPDTAADIVLQSRERAIADFGSRISSDSQLALARELKRNGRLTPTLLVRTLCTGDIDFFECALSVLADVPVENAWRLIHDPGKGGLRAICERCAIPPGLMQFIELGVDVASELQYDGGPGDRERFRERMVARVLTCFERETFNDNIDYLIGKLGTRAAA